MHVGAAIHYIPVHEHPFYRNCETVHYTDLANSEMIGKSILSLPLSPAMDKDDVEYVAETFTKVYKNCQR